ARAANLAWLNSLWAGYMQTVVEARQLPPDTIKHYVEDYADALAALDGNAAKLALQAGLVDKVATWSDVRAYLRERVGGKPGGGHVRHIGGLAYLAPSAGMQPGLGGDSRIALVVVEGPIVTGESVAGASGGQTVARLIERARHDDHVAAMVLRINSPGGSVV